jgi:hypothetical protein
MAKAIPTKGVHMRRHLNSNATSRTGSLSSKLRYAAAAAVLLATAGTGLLMAGPANASGPIVCTACRPIVVTEGPTSLEVGTVNIDGAHPDWMVTGYSYLPGKTFTVKIENATSGHVYDSTTATSQSNGTFGALSPVNPENSNPKTLDLSSGLPIRPLPTCGVSLHAVVSYLSTATSETVTLPACLPPPPLK